MSLFVILVAYQILVFWVTHETYIITLLLCKENLPKIIAMSRPRPLFGSNCQFKSEPGCSNWNRNQSWFDPVLNRTGPGPRPVRFQFWFYRTGTTGSGSEPFFYWPSDPLALLGLWVAGPSSLGATGPGWLSHWPIWGGKDKSLKKINSCELWFELPTSDEWD